MQAPCFAKQPVILNHGLDDRDLELGSACRSGKNAGQCAPPQRLTSHTGEAHPCWEAPSPQGCFRHDVAVARLRLPITPHLYSIGLDCPERLQNDDATACACVS